MKSYLCSAALVAGLALFAGAFAQVPVGRCLVLKALSSPSSRMRCWSIRT
jgi:hypothetical protein